MAVDELNEVRERVREIPDFPNPGILFRDLTPVLQDARLYNRVIDQFVQHFLPMGIDYVMSPEARGFIFGSAVALRLGAGFVPVRKPGKLPFKTIHVKYDMEYRGSEDGSSELHIHEDCFRAGAKILVLDDVLATGGTARACQVLAETLGGKVVGAAFVLELSALKGREKLKDLTVTSLIKY